MALVVFGQGSAAGADGDWNTAANWTGDTLPGSSDEANFDTSSPVLLIGPSASTLVDKFTMDVGAAYPDNTVEIRNLEVTTEITLRSTARFIFTETNYGNGAAVFTANQYDGSTFDVDRAGDVNMIATQTVFNFDSAASGPSFNNNTYAGDLILTKETIFNVNSGQYAKFKTIDQITAFSSGSFGTTLSTNFDKDNWFAQHWTQASAATINGIKFANISGSYGSGPFSTGDVNRAKMELWSTTAGVLDTLLAESETVDLPELISYLDYIFLTTEVNLAASGTYALVFKGFDGQYKNINNYGGVTANTLTTGPSGGKIETTSDSGATWTLFSSTDYLMFDFYYTPPTVANIGTNGYLILWDATYFCFLTKVVSIDPISSVSLYFNNGVVTANTLIHILDASNYINYAVISCNANQIVPIDHKIILRDNTQFTSSISGVPLTASIHLYDTTKLFFIDSTLAYPHYVKFHDKTLNYATTQGSFVVFTDDSENRCLSVTSGEAIDYATIRNKVTKGSF